MSEIKSNIAKRANLIKENSEFIENKIIDISSRVISVILKENKLMFCGNGGSAAECQHMSAEFCATLNHKKPRLGMASISLTTDSSFLTAWTNDFGYKEVFSRQVNTLGKKEIYFSVTLQAEIVKTYAKLLRQQGRKKLWSLDLLAIILKLN
tara:strand:- start:314 stop:769 length:456 start_codon:yes stop_codon:yes gene_type:complete